MNDEFLRTHRFFLAMAFGGAMTFLAIVVIVACAFTHAEPSTIAAYSALLGTALVSIGAFGGACVGFGNHLAGKVLTAQISATGTTGDLLPTSSSSSRGSP